MATHSRLDLDILQPNIGDRIIVVSQIPKGNAEASYITAVLCENNCYSYQVDGVGAIKQLDLDNTVVFKDFLDVDADLQSVGQQLPTHMSFLRHGDWVLAYFREKSKQIKLYRAQVLAVSFIHQCILIRWDDGQDKQRLIPLVSIKIIPIMEIPIEFSSRPKATNPDVVNQWNDIVLTNPNEQVLRLAFALLTFIPYKNTLFNLKWSKKTFTQLVKAITTSDASLFQVVVDEFSAMMCNAFGAHAWFNELSSIFSIQAVQPPQTQQPPQLPQIQSPIPDYSPPRFPQFLSPQSQPCPLFESLSPMSQQPLEASEDPHNSSSGSSQSFDLSNLNNNNSISSLSSCASSSATAATAATAATTTGSDTDISVDSVSYHLRKAAAIFSEMQPSLSPDSKDAAALRIDSTFKAIYEIKSSVVAIHDAASHPFALNLGQGTELAKNLLRTVQSLDMVIDTRAQTIDAATKRFDKQYHDACLEYAKAFTALQYIADQTNDADPIFLRLSAVVADGAPRFPNIDSVQSAHEFIVWHQKLYVKPVGHHNKRKRSGSITDPLKPRYKKPFLAIEFDTQILEMQIAAVEFLFLLSQGMHVDTSAKNAAIPT